MSFQYQRFPELTLWQRNQLFSYYAELTGSMLFDSSQSPDGRYDILVMKPEKIYSGKDITTEQPLNYLREQLNLPTDCDIPDELAHLPCLGGLFFALSYDLGKYYENITDHATDDLKLADYFAVITHTIVIIDHQQQSSFLICSEQKQMTLYNQLSKQIHSILDKPTITTHCDDDKENFKLDSDWTANFSKQEYIAAFDQVQTYIQSGDCYQVNLAQRFQAQCSGSSWQAYCKLSEANHAPYSAFINTGEADILSLSPERFLALNDKQVETKPIKGTRPRGQTATEDYQLQTELQQSKKDQAENLMIVDLMRNDLGRSCIPGSISVPDLFKLESFHSVHHLVSTIIGTLEEAEDAFSLLANSFPGGSITGAPKIRAMNIIDQLEPHRRSYYCGSIGYIDIRGNMDSNISIRTLVRKQANLYCWAGGGLVSASKHEEEYQEMFDKVSRILPVLQSQD